jgi:hypothetical protein
MFGLSVRPSLGVLALALLATAPVHAQLPPYIEADPAAVTKAFGKQIADKIFSGAYTPRRQRAVLQSVKAIPGYDCPADPPIVLGLVSPYPIKPGTVSWVEHYVVMCQPRAQRNFLMIVDQDKLRVIDMLPGESAADPLLQRDAMQGAQAALIPVTPEDCKRLVPTDTSIVGSPPNGRDAWVERWTFDVCGKKAALDMTFTPSPNGGTDWSTTLVK